MKACVGVGVCTNVYMCVCACVCARVSESRFFLRVLSFYQLVKLAYYVLFLLTLNRPPCTLPGAYE